MHLASGVTERAVKLEWRIIDLAKLVGQGLRRSKTWRSFTHSYLVLAVDEDVVGARPASGTTSSG